METRSNNVFVGVVVLAMLALTIAAAFWFARIGEGDKREYDIFFKQSVGGLAKGSGVSYSGVPSGQIKSIELWKKDPDYVRVRISLDPSTPILQGTTATINSVSLTGPSEIQLDGAVRGAPPITCPEEHPEATCPEGVPVIPTKPGALGELLNSAPQLLNRIMTLTERFSELLNDNNQKRLSGILANVDSLTNSLARSGPELSATIEQARQTLENAADAAAAIRETADTANGLLNNDGKSIANDLRRTIEQARGSLANLDETIQEARPGVASFSKDTMPQISLLVRDLRQMSQSLREVTDKLNEQGAASLIGSPGLPDYKK